MLSERNQGGDTMDMPHLNYTRRGSEMADLGLVSDTFSQVHSCLVKAGQVHSEYYIRLSSKVRIKSTKTAYMYITQSKTTL